MWAVLVVIAPAFFDAGAGVAHGHEPRCVQALLTQPAVKGFYVSFVCWLSGPGEVQLDLVETSSLVQKAPGELGAVVDPDTSRFPAAPCQPVEFFDDLACTTVRSRGCREGLSRATADDGQNPEQPFVEQPVRHAVPSHTCFACVAGQ